MGLKRRGKGPFKGYTPRRTFQTVDVGAGFGDWLRDQAVKFPGRKYVAVDPAFGSHLEKKGQELRNLRIIFKPLRTSRVVVKPMKISEFIDEMESKGLKTRHINIDLPDEQIEQYNFDKLFREAQRILIPNGKIFVSSEKAGIIYDIKALANKHGLKTRLLRPFEKGSPETKKTLFMRNYGFEFKIHRLEITFGLKKAIPLKMQRRKWPNSKHFSKH